MGSQVEPVKEINSVSSAGAKSEGSDMDARVKAMWEQMNKGVSDKSAKPSSTKKRSFTAMNSTTSQKLNDSWMMYLGLVPKENGSSAQVSQQKGSTGLLNGGSDEDKKIAALWEQMNKGISNKIVKPFQNKSSIVDKTPQKSDNWMTYLGLDTKKSECSEHGTLQNEHRVVENSANDEARKLAAAALSAVKEAAVARAATSSRGKVEITEVRDFAGQEIEVRKLVDVESKEAVEKAKASAPSAVDAVLEQIKKKSKLSVLDKTKKDWGEFKEENKGLEDELDAYKKSSNQYLDKVSFLQRADYREFERERDARLALQARRRPDMSEE